MSSSLSRYKKRIRHEFDFNGEKFAVRGLTISEIERSEKLDGALKNSFFYGCGLLKETEGPEFEQQSDETDEAFATRVKTELIDVPMPTLRKLIDEIVKTTMPPKDMDGFVKN